MNQRCFPGKSCEERPFLACILQFVARVNRSLSPDRSEVYEWYGSMGVGLTDPGLTLRREKAATEQAEHSTVD